MKRDRDLFGHLESIYFGFVCLVVLSQVILWGHDIIKAIFT